MSEREVGSAVERSKATWDGLAGEPSGASGSPDQLIGGQREALRGGSTDGRSASTDRIAALRTKRGMASVQGVVL